MTHRYKKQPVQMLPAHRPRFELENNLASYTQPKQDAHVQLHTQWLAPRRHAASHKQKG